MSISSGRITKLRFQQSRQVDRKIVDVVVATFPSFVGLTQRRVIGRSIVSDPLGYDYLSRKQPSNPDTQ